MSAPEIEYCGNFALRAGIWSAIRTEVRSTPHGAPDIRPPSHINDAERLLVAQTHDDPLSEPAARGAGHCPRRRAAFRLFCTPAIAPAALISREPNTFRNALDA